MTVTVRPMRDEDAAAWDAFVRARPEGTFFHLSGWRDVFRKVLRLDTVYLLAEQGGQITGILPMVHQRSLLFGHALIAAPFCTEGGPLAADAQSLAVLDAQACRLMDTTGASYLEYRSRRASRPGWAVKDDLYATFARDIHASDEDNLLAIPRKERAVVRHAMETLRGVATTDVEAFYRIYALSVRNLGTPVFPKRWFTALQDVFGGDCDMVMVRDRGRPVSAVMNFYFRDTVLPYYGGGTAAARHNGANSFLYWEVMRRAAQRGCRRFDFGRSKAGTGAFAFKCNWGFTPQWLAYEYRLPPGGQVPQKNPLNPKYRTFIALWKRLPLPLANALGPMLIRNLG